MTRTEKTFARSGIDFETRILIHFFIVLTILNGGISDHADFRPHEMKISPGQQRSEDFGKIYQVKLDHHVNGSKTTFTRNILLDTEFDKILFWIFDNEIEKGRSCEEEKRLKFKFGERFAFRKRLQFALLPIMYKMGVMTTLLTGLTVLALKGLTIGVILLIFAFGNYFTKLQKNPYQSNQPIHVHVHSQDGHKVSSFPSVVGPWDRVAEEVHPSAILETDSWESYRRLFHNQGAPVKFKPLLL